MLSRGGPPFPPPDAAKKDRNDRSVGRSVDLCLVSRSHILPLSLPPAHGVLSLPSLPLPLPAAGLSSLLALAFLDFVTAPAARMQVALAFSLRSPFVPLPPSRRPAG